MEKKEDFYHELDNRTKHSFCTCQTMAISLVLLAILSAVGLAVAVKKVTTAVAPSRTVVSTRQDSANLQQKVSELAMAPGASTSLVITEKELTAAISQAVSQSSNFPLRDVQAEIDPEAITLTGTATKFLNTNLTVTAIPKVVDGRPKLELVKIQAGSLPVPTVLTELIAKGLEDMLAQQLGVMKTLTVKSIQLDESRMTVTGTVGAPSTPDPS